MAEAIEDHRASNDYEPRSLYGKIVSEADRDIDYTTILTRVIQFSLKNFPNYTFEQHFTRAFHHINDKYGENGYLKLWLNTETNRQGLKELRQMLSSEERFCIDFKEIFDKHTN